MLGRRSLNPALVEPLEQSSRRNSTQSRAEMANPIPNPIPPEIPEEEHSIQGPHNEGGNEGRRMTEMQTQMNAISRCVFALGDEIRKLTEGRETRPKPPLRQLYNPASTVQRSWIQPPPIEGQYEIKSTLIGMLPQFYGNSNEDPFDHIQRFTNCCDTLIVNDNVKEYVLMKAFPFSLKDKADQWIKNIGKVITTWEQLQSEFLKKFFPIGRTNALRNAINTFTQLPNEHFHETWERFQDLIRKCPHHGITQNILVQTFYGGLNETMRFNIDASCGGSHLNKDEDFLWNLFESMAENSMANTSIRTYAAKAPVAAFRVDNPQDTVIPNLGSLVQKLEKIDTVSQQIDQMAKDIGGLNSENLLTQLARLAASFSKPEPPQPQPQPSFHNHQTQPLFQNEQVQAVYSSLNQYIRLNPCITKIR